MTEETNALTEQEAAQAAPDPAATAAAGASPVIEGETKPEEKAAAKTFSQEDVDRIVAKEKARAERRAQRDLDRRIAEAVAVQAATRHESEPAQPQRPTPDKFASTEDYVEAVAEWKAQEIVRKSLTQSDEQRQAQARQAEAQQVLSNYRDREDAAREKYADFEEVAYNPNLTITEAMAQTIQQAELGPEIAYFLGSNPAEAARIAKLSPFLQAKELGRLEAKISAAPPPKKPSAAPEPIKPVTASGSTTTVDTTDPKSLAQMGTSAWIDAERNRQRARMESMRRR